MTISSTVRRAGPYATNGVQTAFPFAFKVFAAADVQVTQTDTLGDALILVLDTHYTVALNADQETSPGGTVTTSSALDDVTLTIISDMEIEQPAVFTNSGGFYPRVLNDSLDRRAIVEQQLEERLDRALSLPLDAVALAGKYPVVLSDGTAGWSDGTTTDAALRVDLATPTTGAGLIAVSSTEEYPENTVGSSLKRFFNFSNPQFELLPLGPSVPDDGVYIGAGGNALSFQTLVSVPSGVPDIDNQRATMLLAATTTDDGNSEEQTLCLLTTIGTGFRPAWAQSTAYALGANVEANNQIYRCVSSGTSAASGSGPSGVGTVINDGTVVWRWINAQAIGAKLGVYNETLVVPGAGSAWAMVNNLQLETGYQGGFAATIENDLQNNSGVDSTVTSYYKFNTWLSVAGPNKSTAGIELTSSNLSNPAAIWGLHFSGDKLAEKAVIGIEASAEVGIGIGQASGGLVNPTFSVAAYRDTSTSPKGISLAGNNSSAAIEITATTPVAVNIGGTKSLAGIREGSTTPKGISLEGTYSSTAIEVTANTPVALNIGGAKSLAGIRDGSSSPRGLLLEGTYSKSPIRMASLPPSYADDAAAAAGGLLIGDVYRTGSALKVRVA